MSPQLHLVRTELSLKTEYCYHLTHKIKQMPAQMYIY